MSAAIVDGCRYAKENGIDILLCDTAGRLQNKQGLMQELSKMNRVAGKEIPGEVASHEMLEILYSPDPQPVPGPQPNPDPNPNPNPATQTDM